LEVFPPGYRNMSKIVFVQREIEDKLGPMLLTAQLKSLGFAAEIIINPLKNIRKIKQMGPDFIGINILSPSIDWALSTCRFLKKEIPDALIILGGPHPTFFPQVVEQPGVDIICIGEGEKPLSQMFKKYDGSLSSIKDIPNLWIKDGNSIIRNSVCSLLSGEELSELPFCDRTHYLRYSALRNNSYKRIWTSRGCPNDCSFCFNHAYKKIYKGLGKIIRQRSVDSVINEIKEIKKYNWKCLEFVDDQFLWSRDWIFDFCEKYAKEINLPFICGAIANQIKPDIVSELKRAGCKVISFGIESGVERLRKDIYNKPVSNDDIFKAADILHTHNMPFLTYNMVGFPTESMDDIYETIKINQEIRTTYPWCSILQPYPGTQIANYFKKQGYDDLLKKFSYTFFQESVIDDPVKRKIISNAQKLFAYFVKSSAKFDKFVRLVQKPILNMDKLYPLMFYWHYGKGIKKRYGLSWFVLFRYWLYSR